jgi:UDP-N-acetylmuramoylalanine--D-glutamate ligase
LGGADNRDSFLDHLNDPGVDRFSDLEDPMSREDPMSGFPNTLFRGKRYAVVGLGKNGLPAAQTLATLGAEVVAWDDSPVARETAAGLDVRDPVGLAADGFEALVLSPGIPHHLPKPHAAAVWAKQAGLPIICDVELLYQAVRAAGSRARFVGITGTNGKSTTTALLAHILHHAGLPVAAGANLGPAALSLPQLPDMGVYVLETSSYMLERIASVKFDAAAMLNLSADHIDRHGDLAGYAKAKRAVFDRQSAEDLAVVGVDDALSRQMADDLVAAGYRVIRVSGSDRVLAEGPALPGAHNRQNTAAATAVARFFGVSDAVIAEALMTYPGLPHRQQKIVTVSGVTFVNDSKATNADAAERALTCYDRVVWIAGGMAKEGGIEPLVPLFPRIAHALLIGRDAPILAKTLAQHGVSFEDVGTLENAVAAGFARAKATGAPIVLLSPACASWDQFTGYDQRGERFAELAQALCHAAAGEK